jgi:hypothetical protein
MQGASPDFEGKCVVADLLCAIIPSFQNKISKPTY